MKVKSRVERTFIFSTYCQEKLKQVNPNIGHSEIIRMRVAHFYVVKFNVWMTGREDMKMGTTISKPTQQELETALLAFLSIPI